MNAKRKILSLLIPALTAGTVLFSQENEGSLPASAEVITYPVYRPETVADSRCVRLKNGHNNYVLKFVEQKPNGATPGVFQIRMREPCAYYSFSRPIQDFIRIRSGRIQMESLSPDLTALRIWNEKERSGVTLPLNFGGTKFDLSFWLTKDSPVLFGRLEALSGELGDTEIQINAVVSMFKGIHAQNVYRRQARFSGEIREADLKPQALPSGSRFVILSDELLQPDREKKSIGPCYVQWDPAALGTGTLFMPNDYHTNIRLIPKPEAGRFDFGLLECRKPRTNAEFLEYVTPFLPKE